MKLWPCPKCLAKGPLVTMASLDPNDNYCKVTDKDGRPHGSWVVT